MVQSFERRLTELEGKEQHNATAAQQAQAAAAKVLESVAGATPSLLSREEARDMMDLLKEEIASSIEGIRQEVADCSGGFGVQQMPLPQAIVPLEVSASDTQLAPKWGGVSGEPVVA